MERNTELRHVPNNIRVILAQLLNSRWQSFMGVIPKELGPNSTVINNEPKYNVRQISDLEKLSEQHKFDPTIILFNEWSTSGKIRPNLGHLRNIFTELQMLVAAKYISCELLKEEEPARPTEGPGAKVPIPFLCDDDSVSINDSTLIEENAIRVANSFDGWDVPNEPNASQLYTLLNKDNSLNNNQKNYSVVKVEKNELNHISANKFTVDANENHDQIISENLEEFPKNDIETDRALDSSQSFYFRTQNSENLPIVLFNHENKNRYEINTIKDENLQVQTKKNSIFTRNYSTEQSSSQSGIIPIVVRAEIVNQNRTFSQSSNVSQSLSDSNYLPSFNRLHPNYNSQKGSSSEMISYDMRFNEINGSIECFDFEKIKQSTNNFSDNKVDQSLSNGGKLGEGGFSDVYLAINLHPQYKYTAVKLLKKNEKYIDKFFREVDILPKYPHENLVKLLGYSRFNDELCLIYNYIHGGSLSDKLDECRLKKEHVDWKTRIKIIKGCSEGITFLHTKNIIHRDIKSTNILLQGNIPKICDFGLLRDATNRSATQAVGTNPYMAPEAIRGASTLLVDVFAFGVVLLELVTGLKVLDPNRIEEDLVSHFESHSEEPDYHLTLTDWQAGEWRETEDTDISSLEIFELIKNCLKSKVSRPQIHVVNSIIETILLKYCS